jgi:hypothetical protein
MRVVNQEPTKRERTRFELAAVLAFLTLSVLILGVVFLAAKAAGWWFGVAIIQFCKTWGGCT